MELSLPRNEMRRWVASHRWLVEASILWLGQHIVVIGLVALFQYLLLGMHAPQIAGAHGLSIVAPFTAWDTWWYTHIAQVGYNSPLAAAFPPLYPLLIAIFAPVFGSATVAGLVEANVAGLGACLLLRWVLDPVIGARASQRTLLYLVAFPTAVYFMAAYTESLFLLLSLAVFAALQRRAFWWAGLFAGLAIMTRYTGAFLVFPLLVALWQARAVWWRYLSAALAPLLMGAFWLYFILRFHVLPTTAISHEWHSMFAWPWTGIVRSIAYLTADGNTQSTVQTTARDLLLTLVLLALAAGVWRLRLPLGFKVYAASFVLFVLADPVFFADHSDPLWAVPRYLLPIFPLFIPLAQWSLRSKGAQLALVAVTLTVSTYLLVGFSVGGMLA